MTKKEASFILANIDRRVCDGELSEALDIAIKTLEQNSKYRKEARRWKRKVLEQEPVLDKIRAEIEKKIKKRPGLNHTRAERERNDAFLEVLDIIDKYKAESEVEE